MCFTVTFGGDFSDVITAQVQKSLKCFKPRWCFTCFHIHGSRPLTPGKKTNMDDQGLSVALNLIMF